MIVNLTGHRPFQLDKASQQWVSKLEYVNDAGVLVKGNSRALYNRLVDLFRAWFRAHPEVSTVITGMAMGVDLAGAEAALEEGREVWAYVPYPGHGEEWKTFYKEIHASILKRASRVIIPTETPKKHEFAKFLLQRNIDMVTDSELTLALWDGTPGGTAHCVSAAEKKHEVVNLWPIWEKYRGRK